jgi:uncharacterized protein (TIGR00369 family)
MITDELLRAVNDATGFTRAAGVEILSVETGHVRLRMPKQPALLQFHGQFHGGAIAGLADHAAGAAASTTLPEGRIAVTVDLHVNFIAAADGEAIIADARAISTGKTICVASVEVSNEGGSGGPCAVALVTLKAVAAPPVAATRGTPEPPQHP